ncbi:zinc finger protein 180-like [Oncorhynchus masou masou]|uniref:zinc finger protein 180-like n=1 Tax=Oncorhynchus masou masou TaxID=90313 RepID=UPI0031833F86
MTKLQYLNVFLTERLMQAAEEILGVIGNTISEYQEEITRTKRENQYLKRHLITPAPQPIVSWVSEQQTPPEQQYCEQEWSPSLGQRDPEPTQMKEEQGELRTRQEEEQIQGPEADTKEDSIIIPLCVKGDCDQEPPQSTHLPQTVENREKYSLLTNTTGQIKTEPGGEGYGVSLSEPTSDSPQSQPLSAVNPDCSRTQSENTESVPDVSRDPERRPEEDTQTHSCTQCGAVFCELSQLKAHMLSHTEPHSGDTSHRQILCTVCWKSFTSTSYLKVHLCSHTKDKPFHCGVCGKSFSYSGRLKEHQRIHTGERPYRCHVCGKRFNQSVHLKTHLRVHTGEKPYSCPVCGKGFSQSSHIKGHLRTHTEGGRRKMPWSGKSP